MKLTRFEAICLFLFVWLLISSCGAVKKIFHKETSEKQSASTSQVMEKVNKTTSIDAGRTVDITDSSLIETDYERKVVTEDYFYIDSVVVPGTVIRKTTTTEKGRKKEQKAVTEQQLSNHAETTTETKQRDSSGSTIEQVKTSITDSKKEREEWQLFSLTNCCWLVFILVLLFVFFRYIWPAFKATVNMPPPGL